MVATSGRIGRRGGLVLGYLPTVRKITLRRRNDMFSRAEQPANAGLNEKRVLWLNLCDIMHLASLKHAFGVLYVLCTPLNAGAFQAATGPKLGQICAIFFPLDRGAEGRADMTWCTGIAAHRGGTRHSA